MNTIKSYNITKYVTQMCKLSCVWLNLKIISQLSGRDIFKAESRQNYRGMVQLAMFTTVDPLSSPPYGLPAPWIPKIGGTSNYPTPIFEDTHLWFQELVQILSWGAKTLTSTRRQCMSISFPKAWQTTSKRFGVPSRSSSQLACIPTLGICRSPSAKNSQFWVS